MDQELIDLLGDALLLLKTSEHSHTVLWQKARANVLAQCPDRVPAHGPLGELMTLRMIAGRSHD
jgi:hypothetical protein